MARLWIHHAFWPERVNNGLVFGAGSLFWKAL